MKHILKIAAASVLGMLSAPLFADYDPLIYHDCNLNGLNNIDARDPEKADSVFYNRLGNHGKGNGGEAIYVFISGGAISNVTCIGTIDEGFGGTLATPSGESSPSVYLPEVDPANSNKGR